jgi:2-polyprenyl-3-methyl-5-hydroxy-6-metoxy-1,4-benzoquinol methylase
MRISYTLNNDPLGRAVLDFLDGEFEPDILVTSDWADDDVLPVPYLFRSFEEMPDWEQKALKLSTGKILDVGAGSGCHSKILMEMEKNVEAIDISEGAIEAMKSQGIKAQLIDFYEVEGTYDTILFLMNGLGMARTPSGLIELLEKCKSLLNVGGQVLFDSSDLMFMVDDPQEFETMHAHDYYGTLAYQMHYAEQHSEEDLWMYVDSDTVAHACHVVGLKYEKLMEGEHYNYLASIRK